MQPQTFTPDDLYCVYCHARAAGPCAVCGALCCGDCVEVVLGLTLERALCKPCLAEGRKPAAARLWRWVGAGAVIAAAALALLYRAA